MSILLIDKVPSYAHRVDSEVVLSELTIFAFHQGLGFLRGVFEQDLVVPAPKGSEKSGDQLLTWLCIIPPIIPQITIIPYSQSAVIMNAIWFKNVII